MLYRTKVALAIRGDRIEKGKEIDLTAEEAAQLDPEDIEAVSDAPQDVEEESEPIALDDMTLAQLREEAKELGLSTEGTKAAILERIKLHLQEHAEDAPADADEVQA